MTNVSEVTTSAFSHLLGCEPWRIDGGEAEVRLALRPELRNRAGKLHGGAIFSLVDIAMGLAAPAPTASTAPASPSSARSTTSRHRRGRRCTAWARVIHFGSRTLVVEAEVRQDEALVARAQGTFMLV